MNEEKPIMREGWPTATIDCERISETGDRLEGLCLAEMDTPQAEGGTPETDARVTYCDLLEPSGDYADMVHADFARTLERDRDRLRAELNTMTVERDELKWWKEGALKVIPDYQEIGKLLNLPLGSSVSEQLIPCLKALLAKLPSDDLRP